VLDVLFALAVAAPPDICVAARTEDTGVSRTGDARQATSSDSTEVTLGTKVHIIIQRDDAALMRAASDLRDALLRDGRLVLGDAFLVPDDFSNGRGSDLEAGRLLVNAAQRDYANLAVEAALSGIGEAEQRLRNMLRRPEAPRLLARALRLRALTLLFQEEREEASVSFATSFFLDPEFSPAAQEWPPEARLAYSDAVAKLRHTASGSLSIRVQPEIAEIWVDGRRVGSGLNTVGDLRPGQHYLSVFCPGFMPFSAVVSIKGDGKLDHASVFLEELSADKRDRRAVAELVHNFGGPRESVIVKQVAHLLKAENLVVVGKPPDGNEWTAWVLSADGQRRGGGFSLTDTVLAAAGISARVLGIATSSADELHEPWYTRWYTWVVAGGLVAGMIGVSIYAATRQDRPERVTFVLGGQK
jgi:hypothetical protein